MHFHFIYWEYRHSIAPYAVSSEEDLKKLTV